MLLISPLFWGAAVWGMDRPHIIYIIADDLGYSDLGSYGGEIVTPALDRLASGGLRFRQHYTFAKCETTRTSLMSGLFHHKAGLGIRGEAKTIGELLQAGGYKTFVSGKWHLNGNPVERGFDGFFGILKGAGSHYDPYSQGLIYRDRQLLKASDRPIDFYSSDTFTTEAISYMQRSLIEDPDKPIFLYLAYTAPHSPLQAPAELVATYREKYRAGWDKIREERVRRQRELGIFERSWPVSPRNEDIPAWESIPTALQEAEAFRMATYAAMVERMDWNIGRLVEALGKDGMNILDNSLIYFVSDNGASPFPRTFHPEVPPDAETSQWRQGPAWAWLSNTPFRYYKQSQFNGGVTTPMIVHWPAAIQTPGAVVDYPVHVMDTMPTLANIAGINFTTTFPKAPVLDGIDIGPLFRGDSLPQRGPIGFEFGASDFAYLEFPWKIASYRREPWQLFDLSTDRAETHNLARERTDKVGSLAARFLDWIDERNDITGKAPTLFTGMEPATSIYKGREERYENPLTDTVFSTIPPAWNSTSIGNVTRFNIEENRGNGLIEAQLDGAAIGGRADHFGFVHRPFRGNGELVVKIVSIEQAGPHARAGVMIRDTIASSSAFVMAELNADGSGKAYNLRLRYRSSAGATAVMIPSELHPQAPVWVRLERHGDMFIASHSVDGRHYRTFAEVELSLAQTAHGGVALNTQLEGSTGVIRFTDLEFRDLQHRP